MAEPAGVRGLDTASVSRWLTEHLDAARAPFEFSLIAAGGSNLTYWVRDADGQAFALRRPPEGTTLATAHDIDREWTIMSALAASDVVAVPRCLARCDDPAVTGAPFYVMNFVEGTILRTRDDGDSLSSSEASAATDALLAGQIAFHTLDLHAVELAELGRHHNYVHRQLKRWKRQVDQAEARAVPLINELHLALERRVPEERARPALAHGDYRFDNVVLASDYSLAGILDWELCTTGDPIADFAWSMQYWAGPADTFTWLPDPPTAAEVFPPRSEVIERYESATGFNLSDYPFYEAFSWWKQACIVEGVYARRLRGSQGGMAHSGPPSEIATRVDTMLEYAHTLVAALD